MSQVQIHNFNDDGVDSTNTIYLNYTLSCTRDFSATSDTLTLNFSNMFLKMTSHSYYNYWIGVWPKIVFKNGKTTVHTYNPARKIARTDSIYPDINKDDAIFLKPLTSGNWPESADKTYRRYPDSGTRSDSVEIDLYAINAIKNLTNEQRANLDMELYFVADSFDAWWNTTDKPPVAALAGCDCPAHQTGKNTTAVIDSHTGLTAGTVTVEDNGNNTITITGTNAQRGINNNISSSTLKIDFNKGTDPANKNVGTTSNSSFSYGDKDPTTDIINIPSGATSVTVTLTSTGVKGGTVTASDTIDVEYYTFPTPPTKIWINTGKASQYPNNIKTSLPDINKGVDQLTANNDCKPRKKEILMWKWSGATDGGGAAPIGGFRVYIHRVAKGTTGSPATKTPGNTINLSGKTLYEIKDEGKSTEALKTYTSTETSKGSNEMYGFYCDIPYVSGEANDAQFGFIPVDLGFSAGDLCYCEVFTHNTWGDGDRRYSKTNATDADYTPIIGSCNIFNGASVRVRVPRNPPTDNTLVWKEGTVYVYNGTTWKEAEGVYVRKDGQWKEST